MANADGVGCSRGFPACRTSAEGGFVGCSRMSFPIKRSQTVSAPDQPVSRILSGGGIPPGRSSIYAAHPGLAHPWKGRHIGRRATSRCQMAASSLLGLAPGGGYLAACITADAGGLLHHLFTLTLAGGLFSVALFRQVVKTHFPPRVSPAPCSAECGLSSISRSETAIARLTWGIYIIPVLMPTVNGCLPENGDLASLKGANALPRTVP